MASTAVHVANVLCDAARRSLEAAVVFFASGLPQPMLVPVRVTVPQSVSHPVLDRHLLRAAQRQIVK